MKMISLSLTLLAVLATSSVRPPRVRRSRRAALLASASTALTSLATPACAEGDEIDDKILEGIVERAQSGHLSISKVIDRATQNKLVKLDSESLSCADLDSLVRVDQGACDSAASSIKTLQNFRQRRSHDPAELERQDQAKVEIANLQVIKTRIDNQVTRLVSLEEEKGCLDAVATYDAGKVFERAESGRLSTERAIQRARTNQLVSVEDAKLGCSALDALREVDRKALTELQQARVVASSSAAADDLLAAEQTMWQQVAKADSRFASFCQGIEDLAAGLM